MQRVLDVLELNVPESELGVIAAISWERGRIAVRRYNAKPHKRIRVGRTPVPTSRAVQKARRRNKAVFAAASGVVPTLLILTVAGWFRRRREEQIAYGLRTPSTRTTSLRVGYD